MAVVPTTVKAALKDPYLFFGNDTTGIAFWMDYVTFVIENFFRAIGKGRETKKLALDGGKAPRIPITYKTLAKILNAICRHFKFPSIMDMANSDLKFIDVGTGIGIPLAALCTVATTYGAEMDAEAAELVGLLCRHRDRIFIGDTKVRPRKDVNLNDTPFCLPWRMAQPSITVVDVTKRTFTGTTRPATIHVILNLTAARFQVHVCGALVLFMMKAFPATGVLMFSELQHGGDVKRFKEAGLLDDDLGNLLHMEGGAPGGVPFNISIPIGTCTRTAIGFVVREKQRERFGLFCRANVELLPPDFNEDMLPLLHKPQPQQVRQGECLIPAQVLGSLCRLCVYVLQGSKKRTSSVASLSPPPSRTTRWGGELFVAPNTKAALPVGRSTKRAKQEAQKLLQQAVQAVPVSRGHVEEMMVAINKAHTGTKRHLQVSTFQALAAASSECLSSIDLNTLSANDALIVQELQKLKVQTPPRMDSLRADMG